MNATELLIERGQTHGSFTENAVIAQTLRLVFRRRPEVWEAMPVEHREALDMIATKLSRILSGQSTFLGHWEDVAGYAELAMKACVPDGAEQVSPGVYRATHSNSIWSRSAAEELSDPPQFPTLK